MPNMEPINASLVRKFYAEKTVFITGFTGFIGKATVEKLLRSCPEVERIYVLIRGSRGKSGEERLQHILKSKLFDRFRQIPNTESLLGKIIPVNGDVSLDGLGLSLETLELLSSSVSVILHAAAVVKFNATLETVVKTNLVGVIKVLDFAKQMQSLKAFVYVSTAFSNSDILEIYEKVYPIDVDPNVIAVLFKGLSTSLLNTIAPMLIGKKINFYTFSKHLAEVLVQDAQSHVPVCIVRPTIVGPAHREPFPGWVDNFNGYSGFISGSSKGVIRCVYCTSQGTIDVVPVDHVVNLTLVAAMNLGSGSRKMNDLIVYNHSNTPNPYIYSKCQGSLISAFEDNPPNEMFWYPSMIFTKSHVVFAIASFFFHYIPALLADGISIIAGKTPRMLKTYRTMKTMIKATIEIQRADFWFSTVNTQQLYENMCPMDKECFNFNINSVNYQDYVRTSNYGIRYFPCKEEDKDLPRARKNFRRLKIYYIMAWGLFVLFVLGIIGLVVWLSFPKEFYLS